MQIKHRKLSYLLLTILVFVILWFVGFVIFTNTVFSYNNVKTDEIVNEDTTQDYINSLFNNHENDFIKYQEYDTNKKFDVKLIALYLPQFHQFKENNDWHGRGFTEWSNVTKAKPLFANHYQPKLPIDVGFYDLSHDDIMFRQIELAKNYGIGGFAFYYYWFSGKKLMEKPIYNYLNNKALDFPFCIHWANESWSKRWDGGNQEILIEQKFSSDDFEALSKDLLEFFKDDRYIKIDGRPLFIIYRPALFNKELFVEFTKYLRKYVKSKGLKEPYIIATKQFNFWYNPKDWNLDAVMDFELNSIPRLKEKNIAKINDKHNFKLFDWQNYVERDLYKRDYNYRTYRTVFPRWDNSPRKAYTGAFIFDGTSPQIYGKWLNYAIDKTLTDFKSDERIVFINAWNEWAEGAMLEPDIRYGYAYLDITRQVLEKRFTPQYKNNQISGIAVLTGGRNRIAKAIELLNQNKGERLLISGVKRGTSLNLITSREDVKLESVLPIDLGYKATDTVGNAKEIKEWSQKHNINHIYVVTSFYHIPRAKLEVENIIKNKKLEFISTPSDFVSNKWWKNFKSFKFLANEYTKYLIVYVQYKMLGL